MIGKCLFTCAIFHHLFAYLSKLVNCELRLVEGGRNVRIHPLNLNIVRVQIIVEQMRNTVCIYSAVKANKETTPSVKTNRWLFMSNSLWKKPKYDNIEEFIESIMDIELTYTKAYLITQSGLKVAYSTKSSALHCRV